METGLVLAQPPERTTRLGNDVDLLEWIPQQHPGTSVLIVPGWGAHPRYYGNLIAALTARNVSVGAPWAAETVPGSDTHFQLLPEAVKTIRSRSETRSVCVVAESLGAAYLLASGALKSLDRAVFLAPGLILRLRQILNRDTLDDLNALVRHHRIEIIGRRLDALSDNQRVLAAIRESGWTPQYSSAGYVFNAFRASARALIAPSAAGFNWVIHGDRDRLVSPLGSRLLVARLGSRRCHLTILPNVEHGVLWDARSGQDVVDAVAEFCSAADDVMRATVL